MSIEAMRQALERIANIENKDFGGDWDEIEEAREIARQAIATEEYSATQEPKREWVGLTDDDLRKLGLSARPRWWPVLEAALKEKNT